MQHCRTREDDSDRGADELGAIPSHPNTQVCNGGSVHCYALLRTDVAYLQPAATPQGFGPRDLASAYKLNTTLSPGATIAVVDAYNYPNAESDLAKYRAQYGLPACTTANGCLKIVNQTGATSPLPATRRRATTGRSRPRSISISRAPRARTAR